MMRVLIILLLMATSALAQEQQDVNNVVSRMQTYLDLQPDQVNQVQAVIIKYAQQFKALQDSIDQGTMNPSAVDSQRKGIEAAETQDLSAYLKPYQLTRWQQLQAQLAQEANGAEDPESDQYSNLPYQGGQ